MTATIAGATDARQIAAPTTERRGARVGQLYRFELVKMLSQWRIRALLLLCWVAPAAFVALVAQQSSLPADTLFGRWMHATGWAGPLVMLGFAGSWVLPLITSVIAGDVFSSEDRSGTWRHLLVAVRSPGRLFMAKALASQSMALVVVTGLAASSIAGGLAASGDRPLVGVDGHLLAGADAAGKVLLAWACVLAPTMALAALGLIGSIAMGRSPIGLLTPALVAITFQVAQLAPIPVAVRVVLPTYGFVAWSALFARPTDLAPLLVGIADSLVWVAVATALAYLLFVRRDFTNVTYDRAPRGALALGGAPLTGLLALSAIAVGLSAGPTASGIDAGKVQRSVAVAFSHLYRLQTSELHRPPVTEAQLRTGASCARGGGLGDPSGAGNDWRCTVSWHLPGVAAATGTATYQLDVSPNGRYVADGDGPREVNGYFVVRTPTGDAPNPLWQFDGLVDLLAHPSKG